MSQPEPKTIFLKDYVAPSYAIDTTYLEFELDETRTTVKSKLNIRRVSEQADTPLTLHGQELELVSVSINGCELTESEYRVSDTQLEIFNLPQQFVLECINVINPKNNSSLEGLYKSRTMYCTQCEAEGFRKITYYLDRPDVMSVFTVKVIADKSACPVLLSNGNEKSHGDLENNKHWVEWHDPHKKPAYLFALVAGDLVHVDGEFKTMSGKNILLRIFVEIKDIDKCDHAMTALKNSMKWDEKTYGREYDLDIYMIVAVDDFNMGAMENKGLNIFNTSCVLASPAITTDAGYQRVEAVIAHEYFHNWSGNRVTCRDWFQLSLKEGFTVFRDAEFSADMGSRTVKRVEDVAFLRAMQFAEDAGPLSHQVQPDSFIEISNFYTLTIYEKGAEIVRMIRTLIGEERFRKGSDLYFARHDGQAVTIEDFVAAMSDASGRDFTQFMHWYKQAGTPHVSVKTLYDRDKKVFSITFKQNLPSAKDPKNVKPFLIPINLALYSKQGALLLVSQNKKISISEDRLSAVYELSQAEQTLVFENIDQCPVPSFLREFSAPIKLSVQANPGTDPRADFLTLIQHESDGFSRWDASQKYAMSIIKEVMTALVGDPAPTIDDDYIHALRILINDETLDPAMVALMLTLPSESEVGDEFSVADIDLIHHARNRVIRKISTKLFPDFLAVYKRLSTPDYKVDARSIARRALKNRALFYLMESGKEEAIELCKAQFESVNNMTDKLAALTAIVHSSKISLKALQDNCLASAYAEWKDESLAVNLWFSVQATSPNATIESVIKPLISHDAFDYRNPNKLRSVVGAFTSRNLVNFHDKSGAGYAFLTDQILTLDSQNPQIASRLLTPLTKWRRYDENRQVLMKAALEKIQVKSGLSSDVYEVVSKSLL